MKVSIFICAFAFFGLGFEGSFAKDDMDERFEAWLNSTMANFSNWMTERNLDPTPPSGLDDHDFWGENDRIYFRAETYNKWYDGISKNFKVHSVKSNLGEGNFSVSYSYGTPEDIHGGNYSLWGSVINGSRIEGRGEFIETLRVNEPSTETTFKNLYVDANGYLKFSEMTGFSYSPLFGIIELKGLSAGDYVQDVKELMLTKMRPAGPTSLSLNLGYYLWVLLGQIPIENIIGAPFPPQPVILQTQPGEVEIKMKGFSESRNLVDRVNILKLNYSMAI